MCDVLNLRFKWPNSQYFKKNDSTHTKTKTKPKNGVKNNLKMLDQLAYEFRDCQKPIDEVIKKNLNIERIDIPQNLKSSPYF